MINLHHVQQYFEIGLSIVTSSTFIAIVTLIVKLARYVESTNRRLDALETWQKAFFGFSDGTKISLTEQKLRGEIQTVDAKVDVIVAEIINLKLNISPKGELDLKHADNIRRFDDHDRRLDKIDQGQDSIMELLASLRADIPRRQ